MRIFIVFFSLFWTNLTAQTPEIQKLTQEFEQSQGGEYFAKGIQLSEVLYRIGHFDQAAYYASLALKEAEKTGNKADIALALNRTAKATLKNKKAGFTEKKLTVEQFGRSLRLLEESGVANEALRRDNLLFLEKTAQHFMPPQEWTKVENIVGQVMDSLKVSLTGVGDSIYNVTIARMPEDPPLPPSPSHKPHRRERQEELVQRIVELNALRFENELKDKYLAEIPEPAKIPVLVESAIAEAKQRIPVEKEKIEKELVEERRRIEKMDAEETKEALLLAHYKSRYDSLAFRHSLDSINLAKTTLELKRSQAEIDRQRARRSLWMVGSGSAVLLSFFLLLGYRQQRKNNTLLTQKNSQIQKEQQRSEDLLLNILPAEVAEELKVSGVAHAQHYDSVSVLFSDFQDFSSIAALLTPEKLVAELDYCFKAFDHITAKHKLEKIKTIGDGYLCAGGLPSPDDTHAERAVSAALEMQQFLENWKREKTAAGEPYFEARIGIHTGPIVAGVVGVKKFAYDIWGDTVNIASRMESGGQPGKVNISSATFELVKNTFNCSHRGKMEVKHKGVVDMYFVEGRKELSNLSS